MTPKQTKTLLWGATLAALLAILFGALFFIAPVWQPGFVPAARRVEAALSSAETAAAEGAESPVVPTPQPETEDAAPRINVNTATAEELTALPGIGEVRAAAIIAWREEHGPFAVLDDMAQISGISARMVESWRDLATVGSLEE